MTKIGVLAVALAAVLLCQQCFLAVEAAGFRNSAFRKHKLVRRLQLDPESGELDGEPTAIMSGEKLPRFGPKSKTNPRAPIRFGKRLSAPEVDFYQSADQQQPEP